MPLRVPAREKVCACVPLFTIKQYMRLILKINKKTRITQKTCCRLRRNNFLTTRIASRNEILIICPSHAVMSARFEGDFYSRLPKSPSNRVMCRKSVLAFERNPNVYKLCVCVITHVQCLETMRLRSTQAQTFHELHILGCKTIGPCNHYLVRYQRQQKPYWPDATIHFLVMNNNPRRFQRNSEG